MYFKFYASGQVRNNLRTESKLSPRVKLLEEEAIFLINIFYRAQLEYLATVINNKDNEGKYIFKTKSVAGEKECNVVCVT